MRNPKPVQDWPVHWPFPSFRSITPHVSRTYFFISCVSSISWFQLLRNAPVKVSQGQSKSLFRQSNSLFRLGFKKLDRARSSRAQHVSRRRTFGEDPSRQCYHVAAPGDRARSVRLNPSLFLPRLGENLPDILKISAHTTLSFSHL